MNGYDRQRRCMGVLLAMVVAALVAACATNMSDEGERSAAERASGIEEVVVTRAARGRAQASMEQAAAAQPNIFIEQVMGLPVPETPARPALALVSPEEEVWIIVQPKAVADSGRDDAPGSGAMLVRPPSAAEGTARVPLPLTHTAVSAEIDGYISSVNVRQTFENPFAEKIEAVYLFPLPEKSAVNEFLMIVGERRIRGILREKEEAEAIYRQARAQGYQASLLVQHRPNIFEQKVANIEPGKTIEVDVHYFHTLTYNDGWYSFVFPTVVGPRFNPTGTGDPVQSLPRGNPRGKTAVTYLRPGERSGHDLSIEVTIRAGVPIEELRSTHAIAAHQPDPATRHVRLRDEAMIPNSDFVLDFRVAGAQIRSNLLTWTDPDSGQGYFSMMLYPPATRENLPRRSMEMVFVLDCSGSMSGRPIAQAKDAVLAALDLLQPADTFQIIRFSEQASQLGAQPLPATKANIAMARSYLRQLHSGGGTMMVEGIKAALDFPHDPERLRFVSFLTDGYIGNEKEIIREVHNRIGHARIFSFGVGSSVNRYLMERMAREGRGAVAYLGLEDSGSDIMAAFFARISQPAMTDLSIDWGHMQVTSVYPSRLSDLFVGRPLFVTGKFSGTPSAILVSGLEGDATRQFLIDPSSGANPNLSKLWARLRIADLSDRQARQSDPYRRLERAIRDTALEYQLVSAYTAFVAVDASRRTAGEYGTTVRQAVPVPEGVRYGTAINR